MKMETIAERQSLDSATSTSTTVGMLEKGGLLESQTELPTPSSAPPEYRTSSTKKLLFLGIYCALNLGLTLSNKAVMQHVSRTCAPLYPAYMC